MDRKTKLSRYVSIQLSHQNKERSVYVRSVLNIGITNVPKKSDQPIPAVRAGQFSDVYSPADSEAGVIRSWPCLSGAMQPKLLQVLIFLLSHSGLSM
jgi:hypothetical protein